MVKSYGFEYGIIIAAVAASFSVPVFAGSLLTIASDDTAATYQSPTVQVLGTVPLNNPQEPAPAPMLTPSATMPAPQPNMPVTNGVTMNGVVMQPQPAHMPPQVPQVSDQPLQPATVNGVIYITGGIGDEERAQLESVKPNYNMHVISAGRDGEYFGNTHIVISDRRGNELLNVSSGPIFYAELPAGTYMVEARSEGQSQKRSISVGEHHSTFLHFTWH